MITPPSEIARFNMIEQQVRPWDVFDLRVLEAMQQVPREQFVPPHWQSLAFADVEVPLGHNETMMPPKLEGRILQLLQIEPGELVFELGTGSGFLTACMSYLGAVVDSVEYHADLYHTAATRLAKLGIENVNLVHADASLGWPANGGFDAVAITASMPVYDDRFESMLKPGGRMFVICGTAPAMQGTLIRRRGVRELHREVVFETSVKAIIGLESKPAFVF